MNSKHWFLAVHATLLILCLVSCTPVKSDPPPPTNVDLADAGPSFRSFTPTTVPQGQTFSISMDVTNLGTEASGTFTVRFYASDNTTITAFDYPLGFVSMTALAGGATANCDLAAATTAGVPENTYYLGWIIDADGNVPEDDEGNNSGYMAASLVVTNPDVDLVSRGETYASFTPASVVQGGNISVSIDVSNTGTQSSGPFTVEFFLSVNAVITTADASLGTVSMSSISGGAWAPCVLASGATGSLADGVYYVGWIIDTADVVSENDEGNNDDCKTGAQLTILPTPTIDLYDGGETFRSFTPVSLKKGASLGVSCDISNGGNAASGAFSVNFYASSDTVITNADYFLGSVAMSSIASAASATCALASGSTAGIPVGTYYVGWIIDEGAAVPETDETNNTAYKTTYQLTINSATYTVTAFTKGMSTVVTGSTLIWDGSAGTYDDAEYDLNIGFTFMFFGTLYTSCKVGTNGYITFDATSGAGSHFANDPIPDASTPAAVIALFWDDMIVANNGTPDEVLYRLDGTAPNRVLTVEYYSVTHSGVTSSYFLGQIKLYETSNMIELCYDPGNWDMLVTASIGIEDETGTLGYDGPAGSPNIGSEPGTNYRFSHD